MSFVVALATSPPVLRALFKKLPLWGKVLVVVTALLLFVLFLGIVLAVIWITYSFISSGIWKSLPPQVSASIVAGLFAVITLLLSNSITKEREIRSTLRLKEIEAQEALLAKQTEFYIKLVDKLIALTRDSGQADELLKDFYGKLHMRGASEITTGFLEIVDSIKANGSNPQILENDICPKVDVLITDVRMELSHARRKVALLYDPSRFNDECNR